MAQTVLLVGATGMLGGRIARQLLAQPASQLRLLLRPNGAADKKEAIAPLLERGAEIVEGDLAGRHLRAGRPGGEGRRHRPILAAGARSVRRDPPRPAGARG